MPRFSEHSLRATVTVVILLGTVAAHAAPQSDTTAAAATTASSAVAPLPWRRDPLKPEQMRAVRGIGRALLVAKQGHKNDPELVAMHRDMQALAGELEQALLKASRPTTSPIAQAAPTVMDASSLSTDVIVTPHFNVDKDGHLVADRQQSRPQATTGASSLHNPSSATTGPQAAQAPTAPAALASAEASGADDAFLPVRQHLARTQARLQRYKDIAQERGGQEREVQEREVQVQAVSSKVQQLRDEIQAVLDMPASEGERRMAELTAIKERLNPHAAGTHSDSTGEAGRDDSSQTPTFRTLTRHR